MQIATSFVLRVLLCLASLFFTVALPAPAQETSPDSVIVDAWSAEESYFRPVIRFERMGSGSLAAFLADNAQQKGAPFSRTYLRGDSLLLQSDRMDVRFRGIVSAQERVIRGTWTQGERSATLTLTPVEEAAADDTASTTPPRPQQPERPYPDSTEEVMFKSDVDGMVLQASRYRDSGSLQESRSTRRDREQFRGGMPERDVARASKTGRLPESSPMRS